MTIFVIHGRQGVWECGLGGLRAKKGMKINCPGTGSREKGIFGRIL